MSNIDRGGLLHRYLADKRCLLALPRPWDCRCVQPLTDSDREGLHRDCSGWFLRYGISDRGLPGTWAEFTGWFDDTCRAQLHRTEAGDFFRDQVVRPRDRVQRRVPTRAVRALMHPNAQKMWGVQVGAGDRRALRRYVLRRKAIVALSSPRDPLRV